jgi:hypothetical protein
MYGKDVRVRRVVFNLHIRQLVRQCRALNNHLKEMCEKRNVCQNVCSSEFCPVRPSVYIRLPVDISCEAGRGVYKRIAKPATANAPTPAAFLTAALPVTWTGPVVVGWVGVAVARVGSGVTVGTTCGVVTGETLITGIVAVPGVVIG